MITQAEVDVLLSQAGHIPNGERRALFRVLSEARTPLDAQSVWRLTNTGTIRVARSTTIRNLRLFEELGIVITDMARPRTLFSLAKQPGTARPLVGSAKKSDDIEDILMRNGHIMSPSRLAVLDVLATSRRAMDVDDVWDVITACGLKVSLSAVTRSLRLFHDLGLVEICARQGKRRFYKLRSHHRTISLIPPAPSEIVEIEADALVEAIENMVKAHGWELADGIDLRVEAIPAT